MGEELSDYALDWFNQGYTGDQIRETLLSYGYAPDDVEDAVYRATVALSPATGSIGPAPADARLLIAMTGLVVILVAGALLHVLWGTTAPDLSSPLEELISKEYSSSVSEILAAFQEGQLSTYLVRTDDGTLVLVRLKADGVQHAEKVECSDPSDITTCTSVEVETTPHTSPAPITEVSDDAEEEPGPADTLPPDDGKQALKTKLPGRKYSKGCGLPGTETNIVHWVDEPQVVVMINPLPILIPGRSYDISYDVVNQKQYEILGMNDTNKTVGTSIHIVLRDALNMKVVRHVEFDSGINITEFGTQSFTTPLEVPTDLTPSNYELEVAVFQAFTYSPSTRWPVNSAAIDVEVQGLELSINKTLAVDGEVIDLTSLDEDYFWKFADGIDMYTWSRPRETTTSVILLSGHNETKPYDMHKVVLMAGDMTSCGVTLPFTSAFAAVYLPGTGMVTSSRPGPFELSKPYIVFLDPDDGTKGDIEVVAFTKYPTIERIVVDEGSVSIIARLDFTDVSGTSECHVYRETTNGNGRSENKLFEELADSVVACGDPSFNVHTVLDKEEYVTNDTVDIGVVIENNFPRPLANLTYDMSIEMKGYSMPLDIMSEKGSISLDGYDRREEHFNVTLRHTHETGDSFTYVAVYELGGITGSSARFTHVPLYKICLDLPQNATLGSSFDIHLTVASTVDEDIDIGNVSIHGSGMEEGIVHTGGFNLGALSRKDFTWRLTSDRSGYGRFYVYSDSVMGGNWTDDMEMDILSLPRIQLSEIRYPHLLNVSEQKSFNVTVENAGDLPIDGVDLFITSPPEVVLSRSTFELGSIPPHSHKYAAGDITITKPGVYVMDIDVGNGTPEYDESNILVSKARRYGHKLDLIVNGIGDDVYGERGAGGITRAFGFYWGDVSVNITLQNEGLRDGVWLNTSAVGVYRLDIYSDGVEVERPFHFELDPGESRDFTFKFSLSPREYSTTGSIPMKVTVYSDNDPTVVDSVEATVFPLEVELKPSSNTPLVGKPFELKLHVNNTILQPIELSAELTLSSEMSTDDETTFDFDLDTVNTLYERTWSVTPSSVGPGSMVLDLTVNGTKLTLPRNVALVDFEVSADTDPTQFVDDVVSVRTSSYNPSSEFSIGNLVYDLTVSGPGGFASAKKTFDLYSESTQKDTIKVDTTGLTPGDYTATLRLLFDECLPQWDLISVPDDVELNRTIRNLIGQSWVKRSVIERSDDDREISLVLDDKWVRITLGKDGRTAVISTYDERTWPLVAKEEIDKLILCFDGSEIAKIPMDITLERKQE